MYTAQAQGALAVTGVVGVMNGFLAAGVLIALGVGLIALARWNKGDWKK